METFSFVRYDPAGGEDILIQMYDILHTNMSRIAPTGGSYEEDRRVWLSYMASATQQQILLMYAGGRLAGYLQYRVEGDVLCVDEVEISPQYQRTLLFYRFFRYVLRELPDGITRLRAYINKGNHNSQAIAEKLGMRAVGENQSGHSWLYEGEASTLRKYIR